MSQPLRSDTLSLVKAQVEKQALPLLTMLALMWLFATRDDEDKK